MADRKKPETKKARNYRKAIEVTFKDQVAGKRDDKAMKKADEKLRKLLRGK